MDLLLQNISYAYITWEDPFLIGIVSFFLFFVGAIFASFTGVVVHRMGTMNEDDILLKVISYPPSHCESCGRKLSILNLIPILGWLLSKGKCSKCGYKIPIKYPLIEALLGFLVMSVPFVMNDFSGTTFVIIILVLFGFMVAWIDAVHQIIPEELTWFLLFLGLVASPFAPELYDRVLGAALGVFVVWLCLFIVGLLKNENTHAGGDVALSGVAGAWVGVSYMPWYFLFVAILFGIHAFYQKKKGIEWVPMGPAMIIALFALLFGIVHNFLSAFVIF